MSTIKEKNEKLEKDNAKLKKDNERLRKNKAMVISQQLKSQGKVTDLIYRAIRWWDITLFKKEYFSRFYLWNPILWNYSIIEITGWILYWNFLPLFTLPFLVIFHDNFVLSSGFAFVITFPTVVFMKFIMLKAWLIGTKKKVVKENEEETDEE